MGAGYELLMEHKEKLEKIVKELTALTKGQQLIWESVASSDRIYQTEHKGIQIELRNYGYTLEIDTYTITVNEVSASLLEELDSAIQYWLSPRLGSASSPLSAKDHIDSILNRFNS